MPGPLNDSSFIPKRNPVKQKRGQPSRRIYVFTIMSYVALFASLLAAGGTFFYGQYIDTQLNREIEALNTEISSFSETNMHKVLEFDRRLSQASGRLNNSVSVASLLEALESATIDTVQLQSLTLSRVEDESFNLNARVLTDTFDSTIFQRGVFERNQVITGVEINNVTTADVQSNDGGENRPVMTFDATLDVPLSAVPYVVTRTQPVPFTITNPATVFTDNLYGTGLGTTTDEDNIETP